MNDTMRTVIGNRLDKVANLTRIASGEGLLADKVAFELQAMQKQAGCGSGPCGTCKKAPCVCKQKQAAASSKAEQLEREPDKKPSTYEAAAGHSTASELEQREQPKPKPGDYDENAAVAAEQARKPKATSNVERMQQLLTDHWKAGLAGAGIGGAAGAGMAILADKGNERPVSAAKAGLYGGVGAALGGAAGVGLGALKQAGLDQAALDGYNHKQAADEPKKKSDDKPPKPSAEAAAAATNEGVVDFGKAKGVDELRAKIPQRAAAPNTAPKPPASNPVIDNKAGIGAGAAAGAVVGGGASLLADPKNKRRAAILSLLGGAGGAVAGGAAQAFGPGMIEQLKAKMTPKTTVTFKSAPLPAAAQ